MNMKRHLDKLNADRNLYQEVFPRRKFLEVLDKYMSELRKIHPKEMAEKLKAAEKNLCGEGKHFNSNRNKNAAILVGLGAISEQTYYSIKAGNKPSLASVVSICVILELPHYASVELIAQAGYDLNLNHEIELVYNHILSELEIELRTLQNGNILLNHYNAKEFELLGTKSIREEMLSA